MPAGAPPTRRQNCLVGFGGMRNVCFCNPRDSVCQLGLAHPVGPSIKGADASWQRDGQQIDGLVNHVSGREQFIRKVLTEENMAHTPRNSRSAVRSPYYV